MNTRQITDQILTKKAVRITAMRQLLLDYILEENRVLGLSELEEAFPRADRITIYRTLKTFSEKGIVHSIDNGVSEVKYAICKEDCTEAHHLDQHPHFHCLSCGEITCIETTYIPKVLLPQGFQSFEIDMKIKGICGKCEAK